MAISLVDLLRFWGKRMPDRLALRFPSLDLTWRELDQRSDELAAGLFAAGVTPGSVVGILMQNRPEFIESMHAILKLGGIVGLLNIRFTASEMVCPILDSETQLVITQPELADILSLSLQQVPALRVISTEPLEGAITLSDLRSPGESGPAVPIESGDVALLAYTSGTTGEPKGAMLTHGNIIANGTARGISEGNSWRDTTLLALPLAYTGGCSNYFRESIVMGATAVVEPRFEPEAMLETFTRERITMCSAVPVVWDRLSALPNFPTADLSSLRCGIAGGAVLPLEVLKTWQARGVGLRQGYGQTEVAGGFATFLYEDEAEEKIGSCGRVLMHHQLRIADEDDKTLPPGEIGQILVRGPSVMKGYWNKPEATAETLAGGWLHTGDIGVLDEDDFLRIVDRYKDMLISGGLNVYPAEIETVLAGLPGTEDLAVIGVPDERWGEVPMLIVLDASKVDVPNLVVMMESQLADYKRPRYLVSHGEELPRTMSGKILKRILRETYKTVPSDAINLKP